MDPERTRVIHRDLNRVYPTLVRGEGIYLYDDEGNRYIDGSGGSAAVTAIGHGVPEVADALAEQAARLAYAPTHAFTTDAVETCARIIIEEFAPEGFSKVWFVSGGSEATETAVKMAIQYHRDGATAPATRSSGGAPSSTARRSPHSRSAETRRAAGRSPRSCRQPSTFRRATRTAAARTVLSGVRSLVRRRSRAHDPPGRRRQCRRVHRRAGGRRHPRRGSRHPGYFQRIREICDRYDVLFIADEVMTGFGRTGRRWGLDHWGVIPDLIVCAKGISGGYAPLGAVLAKPEFVGEVRSRSGSFVIGHTSSGNPMSCAAGVAVLRYILDNG